jgi:hypothetical protein
VLYKQLIHTYILRQLFTLPISFYPYFEATVRTTQYGHHYPERHTRYHGGLDPMAHHHPRKGYARKGLEIYRP